jgi:hypothetical protein
MKWQPVPYPSMSREQHDDLTRYMRKHGWDTSLGAILVDGEGNLIDGYKRSQVAWELGITSAPARVLLGTESIPDEAERAAKYVELRQALNNKTLVADEAEAWLRGQA